MSKQELINAGKISGAFGIKGWLKVFSYTEPKDNILRYKHWLLKKNSQEQPVTVANGQPQGKGVIVQLDGVSSRNEALVLMGWDIFIDRAQFPPPDKGEFYWADLIGLSVENLTGAPLGVVENLMETGANDILLIKGDRERAIPFLQGQTVKSIDLAERKMVVDWDADF